MPFGPHRGKMMRHVPASYLLQLAKSGGAAKYPGVEAYIRRAEKVLKLEAKGE